MIFRIVAMTIIYDLPVKWDGPLKLKRSPYATWFFVCVNFVFLIIAFQLCGAIYSTKAVLLAAPNAILNEGEK